MPTEVDEGRGNECSDYWRGYDAAIEEALKELRKLKINEFDMSFGQIRNAYICAVLKLKKE